MSSRPCAAANWSTDRRPVMPVKAGAHGRVAAHVQRRRIIRRITACRGGFFLKRVVFSRNQAQRARQLSAWLSVRRAAASFRRNFRRELRGQTEGHQHVVAYEKMLAARSCANIVLALIPFRPLIYRACTILTPFVGSSRQLRQFCRFRIDIGRTVLPFRP